MVVGAFAVVVGAFAVVVGAFAVVVGALMVVVAATFVVGGIVAVGAFVVAPAAATVVAATAAIVVAPAAVVGVAATVVGATATVVVAATADGERSTKPRSAGALSPPPTAAIVYTPPAWSVTGLARITLVVPVARISRSYAPAGSSLYGLAWPRPSFVAIVAPPFTATSTSATSVAAWIMRTFDLPAAGAVTSSSNTLPLIDASAPTAARV